jgi:hypothetical protein
MRKLLRDWEPEIYAAVYATIRTLLLVWLVLGGVAWGYIMAELVQYLMGGE